jgi:GTPase
MVIFCYENNAGHHRFSMVDYFGHNKQLEIGFVVYKFFKYLASQTLWKSCRHVLDVTICITFRSFVHIIKIIIKDGNRLAWIDREVLQLIRKKNRIRRKAKSNDSPIIWERFCKLRHEVKKLLKFKNRNYLSSLSNSLRDNLVDFGRIIKQLQSLVESQMSLGMVQLKLVIW